LIFCETAEGKLTSIATELLGCGKKLASDSGAGTGSCHHRQGITGAASEAIFFGADKVYVMDRCRTLR